MVVGLKCPKCGKTHIWKSGIVPTREGPRTRYKCVSCAHTFYLKRPAKTVPKPAVKRVRKTRKKKAG